MMKLEVALKEAYKKLSNKKIKTALIDSELLLANSIKKGKGL